MKRTCIILLVVIAIIENFSIEIGNDTNGLPARKYILEANPLALAICSDRISSLAFR